MQTHKTQISLITITRNNAAGLKETFQSIESQSFGDFEWIVVDGASTDATRQLLPRLSDFGATIISESDGGIYDAMSKGLSASSGEWVVFINSGDRLATNETLAKVSAAIEDDVDLIYGGCVSVVAGSLLEKKPLGHKFVGYGMFASHQAMYYRAEIARAVGVNPQFRLSGDYDFTCRFLKLGPRAKAIPVALAVLEPGGLSERREIVGRRENWIVQRDVLEHTLLRRCLTRLAYFAASQARGRLPYVYNFLRR